MSTVFYRFQAMKDEARVMFDGTHISVFDLKREIILNNKMGNGKDFDIGVYDNVSGEELKDDNYQIPRSSSLIAKRLPAIAKGKGTAQNYIIGTDAANALTGDHRIESHARDDMKAKQNRMAARGGNMGFGSMTKRFDGKDEKKPGEQSVSISTGDVDEDARIQAMFAQNAETWDQMQDDLSTHTRAPSGRGRGGKPSGSGSSSHATSKFDYSLPPDAEPPAGYICYRCGLKGHWIQNCPSNEDPAAQERKRFVRVTGIPRSFLKTVETPADGEGSSAGAMLTADGGFVRAVPDQRAWQKQVSAKPRTLTDADVRDQQPLDPSLICGICKKLIWEAVKTPCCSSKYCEECIQSHLLEHDFECPSCESKIPSLDKLKVDFELRARVGEYVDGKIEESRKDVVEGAGEEDATGEDGKESENGAMVVKSETGQTSSNGNGNSNGNGRGFNNGNNGNNGNNANTAMSQMSIPALQTQLQQVMLMLANPGLPAPARYQLNLQAQMLNTNITQMQFMASANFGNNNNGNMGMGIGMSMGMGTGMGMNNMNVGMGMGMGMNMNMNMNNNMNNNINNMNMMGNGMNPMGGMGMGMGMGQGMGMGMGNNMMGGSRGRGGMGNQGFQARPNFARGRGMGMGFNQSQRGGLGGGGSNVRPLPSGPSGPGKRSAEDSGEGPAQKIVKIE